MRGGVAGRWAVSPALWLWRQLGEAGRSPLTMGDRAASPLAAWENGDHRANPGWGNATEDVREPRSVRRVRDGGAALA